MKTLLLSLSAALALGLAGCDRGSNPYSRPQGGAGTGASGTPAQSNTPSTPANLGTPSATEKREGANPTQGQVDPKEGVQHKDFQQRGDGAGPKSGG
jgi:hypothetical protein